MIFIKILIKIFFIIFLLSKIKYEYTHYFYLTNYYFIPQLIKYNSKRDCFSNKNPFLISL